MYCYYKNQEACRDAKYHEPSEKQSIYKVKLFQIIICHHFYLQAKLYTPSTPNNSNETHTFMCLGRTGRFGQR